MFRRALHFLLVSPAAVALVLGLGCVRQGGGVSGGDGPRVDPGQSASGPFVRILGTAQDGGLPHAACSCDRCEAARRNPALARRVASLAVVLPEGGRVFLIDATPDLPEQLAALADVQGTPAGRVDRAPVDGVFLTHAHIGHYLGLAYFGYEAVHTKGLPVWATPRMCRFLRDNGPWSQLVSLGNVSLQELDGLAQDDGASGDGAVELGDGVVVRPVVAPHRDEYADTLGFRIEGPRTSLLFVPDTDSWEAWGDRLPAALAGVDVALLDGTFYSADELPGRAVTEIGHPLITDSLERFGEAVRSGALRVLFTHLNHSNPALVPESPERHSIERAGFEVAEDGLEIPL